MSKLPISNKQHPSDFHYVSPTVRGHNTSAIHRIITSTSDKITYAIHPPIDIIKRIEQKIKDGNALNSTEKIQYEHNKSRQEEEIRKDLLYISNEHYKPQTPEGFSVRIINMINEQLQKITQSVHTNEHWKNIYILLRKLEVRGNLEYIKSNSEYNNILGCAEKVYTNGILNLLNVQLTVTASMAPPKNLPLMKSCGKVFSPLSSCKAGRTRPPNLRYSGMSIPISLNSGPMATSSFLRVCQGAGSCRILLSVECGGSS